MINEILDELLLDSAEEKEVLNGENVIKKFYGSDNNFKIKSKNLLKNKLIDIKKHTRFVEFPQHKHDFLEIMYVYSGKIVHHIGNETIILQSGDFLILSRHVSHSIEKTNKNDIGVNIIISNDFLKTILKQSNNSLLTSFLVENFKNNGQAKYLFFHTQSILPLENVMDNLIFELVKNKTQNINILSGLVLLVFNYLNSYSKLLVNDYVSKPSSRTKDIINDYLEHNFATASLKELAENEHYSMCYLSKLIHNLFGKTFNQLLANKRIEVAQKLLLTTDMKVYEIAEFIGYENLTHFYKVFYELTKNTPKQYRQNNILSE